MDTRQTIELIKNGEFKRPEIKDDFTLIDKIKTEPPKVMTVIECSTYSGLTPLKIRKLFAKAELKGAYRRGNTIQIPKRTIDAYLAKLNKEETK